ncbi:hypothetical protein B0H13DRAFT_1873130 [Mycena leptocephala]|nr:hypothetical protein B0H13DRAFT_1873130 [Mycena leptocephala]
MAKSTSSSNPQCFFGVPFFADASSTPSSNRVSATEPIAPERALLAPLARFRMLLGFWAVTATIRVGARSAIHKSGFVLNSEHVVRVGSGRARKPGLGLEIILSPTLPLGRALVGSGLGSSPGPEVISFNRGTCSISTTVCKHMPSVGFHTLQIELDGGTYTDPGSSPGRGSAKLLSPSRGPTRPDFGSGLAAWHSRGHHRNIRFYPPVIGHQARGPDQHCFEPKEGMPPASTLMAASPAIYTPPNAPHTPLARKSARFASSASPRIDVVADSPVHNRAMLSLGPDTSITSLTFMPPTPKTSLATVVQAPGPSPGRLNFSLQQLESESQKIRLEIRAKEQEDKATPKT